MRAAAWEHGEHLGDALVAIPGAEKERLDAYLAAIVPGFRGRYRHVEGRYVTVQLEVDAGLGRPPMSFGPEPSPTGPREGRGY